MTPRILLTAFTSFGRFSVNPSTLLAQRLGMPHHLLEVAYEAVDGFVNALDGESFDLAVHIGVAGNSSAIRLETTAHNRCDPVADVRGHVPASSLIDPSAPSALLGTLWPPDLLNAPPPHVVRSDDAGGYLCNYLYFRMLQRFPRKRIGFLHIPPLEAIGLQEQVTITRDLLSPLMKDDNLA